LKQSRALLKNCQQAEVSRLLICRHRNSGGALVPQIGHNVWLVAGGQIKTLALSTVIKINKELQTSITHSPARLPQAFVGSCII
jgi:hypothetical protein